MLASPGSSSSAALSATATLSSASQRRASLREAFQEWGAQDWLVFSYHAILVLAVLQGDRSSRDFWGAFFDTSLLLLFFGGTQVLVRGRFLSPRAEAILYRITLISTVELSYFAFRRMLPVVNQASLDTALYDLDLRLFGLEPAFAIQPYITPALTEWFSFFYFGYFFLICAHVVTLVFFSRDRQAQHEFTFGVLLTFCVGHVIYMLVPGFGPGVAMAADFSVDFPRGPWFDTMLHTVETGGAQKDIFPSIHTAMPTFITLWSCRHRNKLPFRYTWPLVAFVSLNIILATMYLRWHYLIDVVAGFSLGSFAFWISAPVTRHELLRRAKGGIRPVWPNY